MTEESKAMLLELARLEYARLKMLIDKTEDHEQEFYRKRQARVERSIRELESK